MIPFFDLAAVNAPLRDEIAAAMAAVLDSGQFVLGPQVEEFEREFAAYCGTRHCVGVGNGLDALTLILRGMGLGAGDEVIVPGNTFIATVLAVTLAGCTPVLVDPDARTMTVDPARVEECLTSRTRAVIAVHLYGRLCDMAALRELTTRRGIRLIEDAAQAHGAAADGKRAGALGDAAGFSFYPTKNLGCLGDGGAVMTDDPDLAERIRRLRNYGSAAKNRHQLPGVNSRLDEVQAAVLRVKLRHLDAENARRRDIAAYYGGSLRDGLLGLPDLAGDDNVFHLYVVRSTDRDRLARRLAEAGIGTSVHYPTPPHRQQAYASLADVTLPVTERLAAEVLSIPLHPALTIAERERVVEALDGAR